MRQVSEEEKEQLSLFPVEDNHQEIIERLKEIDLDDMTAREALNFLWELRDDL